MLNDYLPIAILFILATSLVESVVIIGNEFGPLATHRTEKGVPEGVL